jgi:peptidoglycan/LPS O-acetylase OafA/YrhL
MLWTSVALLFGFFWIAPSSALLFRLSFPLFNILLALLMVAVQAFQPLASLVRLRPIQRLADLSYCFYLTHLPILAACAFALEPRLHAPVLIALVGLSLSIMIAWVLWRFVETPIRLRAKRSRTESAVRSANGLLAGEGAAS